MKKSTKKVHLLCHNFLEEKEGKYAFTASLSEKKAIKKQRRLNKLYPGLPTHIVSIDLI